ncbi:MAG: CBS domain-containing protein [Planctomycetota bacterium]|jgi:CBS domain-containing protein
MKVKKVMQEEVASCSLDSPITEAARIMWEHDCGFVPVVEEGKLAGLVTDRDIAIAGLMTGLPLGLVRVREVMTDEVASCDPDDELTEAHAIMRENQVRRLPVVDEEFHLVGVLSLNDLVNEAFSGRTKAQQKRQRDTARTLAEISRHRANGETTPE